MTSAKLLILLHYSRVQVSITSFVLTMANSIVLVGRVQWRVALMVGLGTYVVYNLDNLLDWHSEQNWLDALKPFWHFYLAWCALTMPLALFIIVRLVFSNTLAFLLCVLALGTVSLSEIWISSNELRRSKTKLWAGRVIVSLVWALVCVLTPVLYADQYITPQVVMAIAYVWHLSWITGIIWLLTATIEQGNEYELRKIVSPQNEVRLIRSLQIISVSSLVLAVVDILLKFFPWYNISVVSAPVANWLLLSIWPRMRQSPLLYCNLFFLVNILCSIIVIGTYWIAERSL